MIVEIPFAISKNLKPPFSQMYANLKCRLESAHERDQDILSAVSKCIVLCEDSLEDLRRYIAVNDLATQEAEIAFFRYVKPCFLAQWLFYSYLYVFEANRPEMGTANERKYLKRKYRIICALLDDSRELQAYLKSGSVYSDESFFLRQNKRCGFAACYPYSDGTFTTARDEQVAEIIRNIMLQFYLEDAIRHQRKLKVRTPGKGFQWTGTLAGLYELIYSLIRSGVINNGNITISDLAEFFEAHFQVDLKNIYRGRQEGRIKKERSAFLKKLIKANEEDMDEIDDKNPRC